MYEGLFKRSIIRNPEKYSILIKLCVFSLATLSALHTHLKPMNLINMIKSIYLTFRATIVLMFKKTYANMKSRQTARQQDDMYEDYFSRQNFQEKNVDGEDQYIKKWQVFSKHINPVYYRFFSHYAAGKDINILPASISRLYIEPLLNPMAYRTYYSDKNMFDQILPDNYTPKTILRKMNGHYYDSNYSPLVNFTNEDLLRIIDNYDKVIIKPAQDTGCGKSIELYVKSGNQAHHHIQDRNSVLSVSALDKSFPDNFIMQECLVQSNFMSQFNPSSVNTIRVSMYRSVKNDEWIILHTIMRIGQPGAYIDNIGKGGFSVGISRETGILNDYLVDDNGNKYSEGNGLTFSNQQYQVPNFDSILQFSKDVVKHIHYHRRICLDIMMTPDNTPKLIEFNISALSTKITQYNSGAYFREYTDEVIDFCLKNRHKLTYTFSFTL